MIGSSSPLRASSLESLSSKDDFCTWHQESVSGVKGRQPQRTANMGNGHFAPLTDRLCSDANGVQYLALSSFINSKRVREIKERMQPTIQTGTEA